MIVISRSRSASTGSQQHQLRGDMAKSEVETRKAHEATERLAYDLWVQRGRPFGSPELDWFAAEKALHALHENDARTFYLSAFAMEPDEGPYRGGRSTCEEPIPS